ncbi:ankyrin repeat domain-containing protein 31-like [Sardina pilchardus]|uniref:ankyrin repeat domain-containing protein 31-like n=1 Tax=Sardina pilchardus TaxID=27697 RepID=UPI002E0DABD4
MLKMKIPGAPPAVNQMASVFHRSAETSLWKDKLKDDMDGDSGQALKCQQPVMKRRASERTRAVESQTTSRQASPGTRQSDESPTTPRQAAQCAGLSPPASGSSQSNPSTTRRSLRKRAAANTEVNHRVAPEANTPPGQKSSQYNRTWVDGMSVGEAFQASVCHRSESQQTPATAQRHTRFTGARSSQSESKTKLESKEKKMLAVSQIKRNRFEETKLHLAVMRQHEKEVRDIMRLGTSINIQDYAGWTPLHEAVLTKQVSIVRLLLRGGAMVNIPAHNDVTPLHDAVQLGAYEMVDLLLKHGADPKLKDARGITPIDLVTTAPIAKLLGHPDMKICPQGDVKSPGRCPTETSDAEKKETATFPGTAEDSCSSSDCQDDQTALSVCGTPAEKKIKITDSRKQSSPLNRPQRGTIRSDMSESGNVIESSGDSSPTNGKTELPLNDERGGRNIECGVDLNVKPCRPTHNSLVEAEAGQGDDEILTNTNVMQPPRPIREDEQLREVAMEMTSDLCTGSHAEMCLNSVGNECVGVGDKVKYESLRTPEVSGEAWGKFAGNTFCQVNPTSDEEVNILTATDYTMLEGCDISTQFSEGVDMKKTVESRTNYFGFKDAVTDVCILDDTEECSVSLLVCHTDTAKQSASCAREEFEPVDHAKSVGLIGSSVTESPDSRDSDSPSLLTGAIRKCEQNEEIQTVAWRPEERPGTPRNARPEARGAPSEITPSLQISHAGQPHLDETHTGEASQNSHRPHTHCLSDGSETQRDTTHAFNSQTSTWISPSRSAKRDVKCHTQTSQLNQSVATCFFGATEKGKTDESVFFEPCSSSSRNGPGTPTSSYLSVDSDATMLNRFELEIVKSASSQGVVSENTPRRNLCDVQCEGASTLRALVPAATSTREDLANGVTITSQVQTETKADELSCSSDSDCTMISESEYTQANKSRRDVITETEPANPSLCLRPCSQNDDIGNGNENLLPNGSESETFGGIVTGSNATTTNTSVTSQGMPKHKAKIPKQKKRRNVSTKSQGSWKPWQLGKTFGTQCDSPVDKGPVENVKVNLRTIHKRNGLGETQLHRASKRGDLASVKALIEAGIDVNIADYAGWTALHEASAGGFSAVVEELLCAGADVTSRGPEGLTALHDAVVSGWSEVVKLLLQNGANPKDRNAQGKSALDLAWVQDIKEMLSTFKGPLVQPVRPRQPANECTYQMKPSHSPVTPQRKPERDPKDQEPSRITTVKSNVCFNKAAHPDSIMVILDEVDRKQKDLSTWQLAHSEDKDKFMEEWSQMQTKLNEVLIKQQSAKDDLTNKYRMAPDSFEQGTLRESLTSLASRQKRLLGLLQKQSELKLKYHTPKGRSGLQNQKVPNPAAPKKRNPIVFPTGRVNNHAVTKDPTISNSVSTSSGPAPTDRKIQPKGGGSLAYQTTKLLSGTNLSGLSSDSIRAPVYTVSLPSDLSQGSSHIVVIDHGGQRFAFVDLSTMSVPAAALSKQPDPKRRCSTPPHSTDSSQASLADLELPENPLTLAQGSVGTTSHHATPMPKTGSVSSGPGRKSLTSKTKTCCLKSSTGPEDAAGGAKGMCLTSDYTTSRGSEEIQQDGASEAQGSSASKGNEGSAKQTNQLASLMRQGILTPAQNALEFKLKGSCHQASLLPGGFIRDGNGKDFVTPEQWVDSILGNNIPVSSTYAWEKITFRSRSLSAYVNVDDIRRAQAASLNVNEPDPLPLASQPKEIKKKISGNYMEIKSIQLISNDEFAPTHIIDQYWEVITKFEDWGLI